MVISFATVLLGLILGLALGIVIVLFLIYAACSTARYEIDQPATRSTPLNPVTKYETPRAYPRLIYDSDTTDW